MKGVLGKPPGGGSRIDFIPLTGAMQIRPVHLSYGIQQLSGKVLGSSKVTVRMLVAVFPRKLDLGLLSIN